MQQVPLGSTGLTVSRLCLGGMMFGGQVDEPGSVAVLDRAFEAGITFLDTAAVHPMGAGYEAMGETERVVGRWMRGRRDEIVMATKCTGRIGPGPDDEGSGRTAILRSLERSLRNLGTDHVDLYQFQYWDPAVPIDESLAVMDELLTSGKVRAIGCSNFPAWRLARTLGRAEVLGLAAPATAQPRYNLLYRNPERDLFPLCAEEGIALMPYNPLGGGFLTGRYRWSDAPPADSRFGGARGEFVGDLYPRRYWRREVFDTVDRLGEVAARLGVTLPTLALAWVLARPEVTAPIVGASRPEQLDATLAALDLELDADVLRQLDDLTAAYAWSDAP